MPHARPTPTRPRRRWLAGLCVGLLASVLVPHAPAGAVEPFTVVDTIDVAFTSEMVTLGDYGYVANNGAVHVIDLIGNTVDETVADADIQSPDGAAVMGTNVYFTSQNKDKLIIFNTLTQDISTLATNTGAAPNNCDKPSQLKVVNATRLIANCQSSGNVQIYDVTTTPPTIVGSVTTGTEPRGMTVNNGIVYVPNSFSNDVTFVNAAASTPSAVRTVAVGLKPEFTAYLDGKVYTANKDGDSVSILDAATGQDVVSAVSVGANAEPQGVAACGGDVYTANRNAGTTSVIGGASNSVDTAITVAAAGNVTHVIGSNGGFAYLLNYSVPSVAVVDCNSQSLVTTLTPSGAPSKITFTSQYAYVTTTGPSGKITVISIPEAASTSEYTGGTYADFQFFTPDGRECTDISPVRVRVGTMYELPGVDASCRTMPGSTVAGWTVPGPPGFTGYGSAAMAFPPGLPVRVVESQKFTLVPKEPVLQFDYDANIAARDACVQTKTLHTSDAGRVAHVWVPREDIAMARFPASSSCVPEGYVLMGWNTTGDGSGESYEPGAAVPEDWGADLVNSHRMFAMWAPATD